MMMPAFSQPAYAIRRAEEPETNLLAYLRLASLLSLEMPSHPLAAIRAVMDALPDIDAPLVASGRYWVADHSGELIAGAGWSVLPLSFRGQDIVDEAGGRAPAIGGPGAVLVRGFFLDPDLGRRGAGARLLARVEADAARAGYDTAELVVPAAAQVYYRGLGFKPVARLMLKREQTVPLPLLQMRKLLPCRMSAAA
jgi:GNAT superfamily N-acetyltransferase